ncbi:MAG: hypothetical protein LBU36_05555 [Clostridiales bacterium]|nr:hypothetical protein [Clostridiales bacterium]
MGIALETTAILRSILFQLKTAKSLNSAIIAISAMCSDDDISAVEQKVAQYIKEIEEK